MKDSPTPDCTACTEAKQHEEPYNKHARRDADPGELTHIDLWGKYDVVSINGRQYYIVLVDDASRMITVDFLKGKNEAAQQVKNYLTHLKVHGRNPKYIRVDRGKEFINDVLNSWCGQQGIEIQMTAPYSPSQNGVAERANRTLVELARAMIRGQKMPEFLWEQAVAHAAYLRNRAYTTTIKEKTPYEVWYKRKPNVAHLREFGAPVWILLQGQHVERKILPKSKRQLYVGHDDGSKSVKYYNAETRKILTSRNFRFLNALPENPPEGIVVAPPNVLFEGEEGKGERQLDAELKRDAVNDQRELQSISTEKDHKGRKRQREEKTPEIWEPRKTRGKRIDYRHLNDPYKDDEEYMYAIDNVLGHDEPKSIKEAQNSQEWPKWEEAIKAELQQLAQKRTWELIECPKEAIPIANKWVFMRKYNREGNLTKYKARLVAKGCAQRPGYDYLETFSPVVRMETIRVLLAMAAIKRFEIQQMDVKGAYLNGTLREIVHMRQPEGYEDNSDRVCRLVKTIYGLKQSGREWNKELDTKLKKHSFRQLRSDPCAYIRKSDNDSEIITVWVDDFLLFATTVKLMEKMKADIRSEWEVTDLGEPTKIVGIEITRRESTIKITQQKYIESILRREGMENANPVAMPMDPNMRLEPNPDGNEGNKSNSYARLLGELQFLANATRPDITYAVNRLAAYTANPSLQHVGAIKRVLRYLVGTKTLGITYQSQNQRTDNNLFHGYSDAAFANTDDQKSTSGHVFVSAGGAMTWSSKKQTTVALSSTEAEYVAISEASREAYWLRSLYEELGEDQNSPSVIKGDNEGSIAMTRNPQFHKRAKHISTRWHWVRDLVEEGTVTIESCRDPEQTANVLMKVLPKRGIKGTCSTWDY